MANTKLHNKIRNPKDLDKWLDIWSIEIKDVDSDIYTITPSNHWDMSNFFNGQGSGGGSGQGGGGSSTIPVLRSDTQPVAEMAIDPDSPETLVLKQAIISARLDYISATNNYELSTSMGNISQYSDTDEKIIFGQAIVNIELDNTNTNNTNSN